MSSESSSAVPPLPSQTMLRGITRATHRSLFYSMGWEERDLHKPLVGVVNSFNELVPGHVHLQPLCQAIKMGIAEAGGTPLEFPSIAICDGLATGLEGMRMPMPSREIIADSIELMVKAHALDAMVLLTNCDKITPGMLMAAARLNIPAIVVTAGRWTRAASAGSEVCYTDLMETEGRGGARPHDRSGPGRVRAHRHARRRLLRHDGHGQHHEHPGRGAGHDAARHAP